MRKDPFWHGFPLALLFLFLTLGCQTPPKAPKFDYTQFTRAGTGQDREEGFLGPRAKASLGEQRLLIIPVRFPDVTPRFSLDRIMEKAEIGLSRYVKEQSYGQTWLKPRSLGWVTLPDPLSRYRISPNNFMVDRTRVRKLVEDAMTAVEDRVDFSQYDHILIIPGVFTLPGRGYGMMCYCANPGMLSGVRGRARLVSLRSKGGKEFSKGVFVGTENAPLGFFAHDFLHALGGVYSDRRLVP